MKYDVLIERVKDELHRESPTLLADEGIGPTGLDSVVTATIKAMGFQVTRDHDIVTVAPAPAFDSTRSNANYPRRSGKRR